ncbi:uncharacterized protein EI97DRAFT_433771 [Westerdykella ornata]|uniref:Uncharacterized protein n=1 Tax=Westerdykella ornata TaxID=318751 RepID=A0A6A6JJF6_WESOR|nr:uncharacterized protein EI97DRAFT_433771 [Westerdykella ornata]KAF2275826.1 hypothetical protein EI97DRAFT_433771 [Westerdykella ornata]
MASLWRERTWNSEATNGYIPSEEGYVASRYSKRGQGQDRWALLGSTGTISSLRLGSMKFEIVQC